MMVDAATSSALKPNPEPRSEPKQRPNTADPRLIPGGAHGSAHDIGMPAIDPDAVPVADETPE
jgi:hypothetical protein